MYDAVRKVYAELKIPLTPDDSTTGEIGLEILIGKMVQRRLDAPF